MSKKQVYGISWLVIVLMLFVMKVSVSFEHLFSYCTHILKTSVFIFLKTNIL